MVDCCYNVVNFGRPICAMLVPVVRTSRGPRFWLRSDICGDYSNDYPD